MKRIIVFIAVVFLCLPGGGLNAADNAESFCYVSLVEGEAFVRQAGSPELKPAAVNFPLLPGDAVETGEQGRCELQFDNGTVMRLGTGSRLQINTLRADSLTTNKKITILELTAGRIFSMNNTYNRELFQVVTPLAAFKLDKDSTTTVSIEEAGNRVFVAKGRIGVLYGDEAKRLKKAYVRAGTGALISAANRLIPHDVRPTTEFQLWNEYVNSHFKELHHGISKLPKPIYKFPPAVVNFAEKWSSLFGEWEYNDLLGYVWKPYDESFKYADRRPFFHARYVTINNQLYVVPTQPWGWVPAHLGTWVWMKKNGWVWIPGTAFTPGMYGIDWLWSRITGNRASLFWAGLTGNLGSSIWPDFDWLGIPEGFSPFRRRTLSDWIRYLYGGYAGYEAYRRGGEYAWKAHYAKSNKFANIPPPSLKDAPPEIAGILQRMNKTPLKELNRQLQLGRSTTRLTDAEATAGRLNKWLVYRSFLQAQPNGAPEDKKAAGGRLVKGPVDKRDWNPDRAIAHRLGTNLVYSSGGNAVLIPELELSSRTISARQKFSLRTGSFHSTRNPGKPGLISHIIDATGSVSGSTATAGNAGRAMPVSTGKGGGKSTSANERK